LNAKGKTTDLLFARTTNHVKARLCQTRKLR
jgi:hypothetical protein